MVGILPPKDVEAVLMTAEFARLGCHADGQTYVVPISFAYDGRRLVGLTTMGKKVEMMRKNAEVCVCVDEIRDLTNWRSVVVWGKFQELSGIEAATATGLLVDKYGPIFETMDTEARLGRNVTPDRPDGRWLEPVVYAIGITERSGRFEESKSSPGS